MTICQKLLYMKTFTYIQILCINILPFIVAIFGWLQAKNSNKLFLKASNNQFIYLLYGLTILLLSLTPVTYYDGSDKGRYMYDFDHISSIIQGEQTKDIGWYYFMNICHFITLGSSTLFFIITAIIFTSSFYFFAKKHFNKQYIGYILLMTMGLLGFSSYTNNVIRNGVAIALCLFALSINTKWIKLLLAFIAYLIHGSVLIPIAAFFYTIFIKNNKIASIIWIICFGLSLLNVNTSSLFEIFGGIDERVSDYAINQASAETLALYAKAGQFRWDFLIYSIAPLYIARIWKTKYAYNDNLYSRLLNIYLLCNALWLLVIRQAYSERFAFLSWLMIPIITLYPILKNNIKVKNPEGTVYFIISLFTGVSVLMSLISII